MTLDQKFTSFSEHEKHGEHIFISCAKFSLQDTCDRVAYGSAINAGLPFFWINRPQSVSNVAARLIGGLQSLVTDVTVCGRSYVR